MRKPRSDAQLLNLPPDQQDRLCAWLLDGVETDNGRDTSYKVVKSQLYDDFGVKCSESALAEFYRQVAGPRRLRRAAAAAEEFGEALQQETGANFEEAAMRVLKQKFFELAAQDFCNPKELAVFGKLLGESAKLQLKREELRLNRDKLKASLQSKIDAGIDALFSEIDGNAEAEALITRLREIVNREVKAA